MPNGREHLKYEDYGKHDYGPNTHKCRHGCGCWMGSSMSGSPAGVDAFGSCPSNVLVELPVAFGKPLNHKEILDDFINSRIDYISSKMRYLEPFEKTVHEAGKLTKVWLQTRVEYLEEENLKLKCKLGAVREKVSRAIIESE